MHTSLWKTLKSNAKPPRPCRSWCPRPATSWPPGWYGIEDFEILAFLYIHCADLAKVRRAALAPATWKGAVLEWGQDVPFEVLVGARAALRQSQEMLEAVKFDVEPKPSSAGHKEESEPPN